MAADDVHAQLLDGTAEESRWHEVEVELTGGDRRLLKAADARLRRDGLRPAGESAKLERALGDRLPAPAAERPLTPSSPAGQVVLAYLRAHTEKLTSLDPMVRRDEPDSVHQMRVATRRLRSTLRSFGKIIRRSDTQRLAGELKWLGDVLGEARDGEVLAGHLQAHLRQLPAELVVGPVQARVQGHFAPARAAARDAAARRPRLPAVLLAARRAGPAGGRAAADPAGGEAGRRCPARGGAACLPADRPADAPGAARGGRAGPGRGPA